MIEPVVIKRGDTARRLTEILELDGAVFNLTGHTVVAVFKKGSTVVRVNAVLGSDPTTGEASVLLPTEVVSEAGEWSYEWETTNTTTSKKICVPNVGYGVMIVNPNLQ